MHLRQLARILVQFSPWKSNSGSAREFLFQVSSSKARASNPACEVASVVK